MLNTLLRGLFAKRSEAADARPHVLAQRLYESGRLAAAEAILVEALEQAPSDHETHYMLGKVRGELGKIDEAEQHYLQAISAAPQLAQIHYEYGNLLLRLPRIDEAIAQYQHALKVEPGYKAAETNLIYALNFTDAWSQENVFRAHVEWAKRHTETLTAAASPPITDANPEKQLRVGYVSAHFRDNAVTYFFEPVLRHHDAANFSAYCYSDVTQPDASTERLRRYPCTWRETSQLSDEALVKLIRDDGIDILVDLTGHIKGDRLPAFARRAAPLQLTWNGYVNTTGMSAMDYRITDIYADPPGTTDRFHTERLLRMPEIFEPFEKPADRTPVGPLPAVSRGYVTFGSFNTAPKITKRILAAWASILREVPSARLVILAVPEGRGHALITGAFTQHGIDPARVKLLGRVPHAKFVEAHGDVDIALDTSPFNGCTTTAYALWMGVPVVTLAGSTHASRVSCSMLTNVGLPDLVAQQDEEYVSIATKLASDLPRLTELRATLRDRMERAPNMDGVRFTRFLEDAYRSIWTDYCSDQSTGASR